MNSIYFCGMNKVIFFYIFLLILLISCKNDDTGKALKPNANTAFVKKIAKAVAENSDSIGIRFNYINVLDSIGEYKLAIAQMDSLILKDRGNYGLWFKLAKIYEHSKDTAEAVNCYLNALKIYRAPDGLLALANLYAETKNITAIKLCNEIDNLRMGREYDSYTSFFRGVYFARIGNKQQAILLFDKSIINNYNFMDAYMEKGFALFDDKKYAAALQVFTTATTVNLTFADAYYWQGKCFEVLNNKPQAIAQYQQAIALDKDLPEAAEGIKRLKG